MNFIVACVIAATVSLQTVKLGTAPGKTMVVTGATVSAASEISNVVTKAYVEGLGIEAGVSRPAATNIAEAVVREGVRTNYLCTVEAAQAKADAAEANAKAYADADFVPWVNDSGGNKTAVTIGTRDDENVGRFSFVHGHLCVADGDGTHAEGNVTYAKEYYTHAEGNSTYAEGDGTHAEGYYTHAEGEHTHAEGDGTHAEGDGTHAEGYYTHAEDYYTHAEGHYTHADGISTHAEGNRTHAEGNSTHAEGYYTHASKIATHAEGIKSEATNRTAYVWQGTDKGRDSYINPDEVPSYFSHGNGTFNLNPVGGLSGLWVGETNMADHIDIRATGAANAATNALPAWTKSADKPTYTAAEVGAASQAELTPIATDARNAYGFSRGTYLYMNANTNSWFAGTNYVFGADAATRTRFVWEEGMNAGTVPCSMALYELRDGAKQCVWDQRDWTAWYWSFKAAQMNAGIQAQMAASNAAIRAEIASTNNHAWAKWYAASGRVNPDPTTTYVDTPKVCIAPGMNWESVAEVSGCGYWTIVANGLVVGGSGTNAVLQIKDFEGNAIMTITKGAHRLAWLESEDFTGQMTDENGWVCFDMMADSQPTGYFSTTLDASDFVVQTDANCPAQYRWENLGGGEWRVHFLLKPGVVSNRCFAKFLSEVQGETKITYAAGAEISGGLIYNGRKIAPQIPAGASVGDTITWKVVE